MKQNDILSLDKNQLAYLHNKATYA